MRTLYYVPMIHSDKELSDTGRIIKMLREKIYGKSAGDHDEMAIENLWEKIRLWVHQTIKDARGLVIYQDSMPAGPREKIRQLFDLILAEHSQSPLFRFTKELIDMGAVLEGTEDINLLVKRVAFYREIYHVAEKCQLIDVENFMLRKIGELDELVLQADRFIAKRINETLPEGGRGILFMGYRHRVAEEIIELREAGLLSSQIEIHALKLTINKKR